MQRGRLTGMTFEKVAASKDASGRRVLSPTGEPDVHIACDDVLIAVGQENAFPWIEPDAGVAFDRAGLPRLDALTFQSSLPSVFFGGDSAFGPKNIITAVAHGHEAAISIDAFCRGEKPAAPPAADDQSAQPEDGHPRMDLRQRDHRRSAGSRFRTSTPRRR